MAEMWEKPNKLNNKLQANAITMTNKNAFTDKTASLPYDTQASV